MSLTPQWPGVSLSRGLFHRELPWWTASISVRFWTRCVSFSPIKTPRTVCSELRLPVTIDMTIGEWDSIWQCIKRMTGVVYWQCIRRRTGVVYRRCIRRWMGWSLSIYWEVSRVEVEYFDVNFEEMAGNFSGCQALQIGKGLCPLKIPSSQIIPWPQIKP